MADTLGAQSFVYLRGEIHAPALEIEDISRAGVDYSAFRQMATKPRPSKLVGFADVASATAAHALRTTYAALQGTIVSVGQQTRTYANCIVLSAEVKAIEKAANAVGGLAGGTWLVYSEFEIQFAGSSWSIS